MVAIQGKYEYETFWVRLDKVKEQTKAGVGICSGIYLICLTKMFYVISVLILTQNRSSGHDLAHPISLLTPERRRPKWTTLFKLVSATRLPSGPRDCNIFQDLKEETWIARLNFETALVLDLTRSETRHDLVIWLFFNHSSFVVLCPSLFCNAIRFGPVGRK